MTTIPVGRQAEDVVTRLECRDTRADRLDSPAKSMPRIVSLGRSSPATSRTNQGCDRRMPQSVRLTVVARTLISTSPVWGSGSGTCRTSTTSGGP
jgi:hypothetical protein